MEPYPTAYRAPARPARTSVVSVEPDLRDLSSAITETCGALTLSLHEGDVDAAERLLGFLLDQMPDRRSMLTGVLDPLFSGEARASESLGGPAVFVTSCAKLLARIRRPASPLDRAGVLLYSPDNGRSSLRLQMLALLLDDLQVPVWMLLGTDEESVRQHASSRRLSAACLATEDPLVLRSREPLIRSLRGLGTTVVLLSDAARADSRLAHDVGAAAGTDSLGETADLLLLARGPLTAAEAEVLRLAADGYTNIRIGHELGISVSAVKARLEAAFAHLGAADRTHAVAIALRQRWIA